jgi:hypothetical protein
VDASGGHGARSRCEWARFVAALETHEAGHKDISAKAGRAIVDRLRGLSGLCSQLGSRANDIARDIVDKAAAEQKAYDAARRHGLTQGTAFGASRVILRATTPLALLAPPRPGTVRGILVRCKIGAPHSASLSIAVRRRLDATPILSTLRSS